MGQPASIQLLSTIAQGAKKRGLGSPEAPPQRTGRAPIQHHSGPRPLWELAAAGTMVELSGTAPGKLSTVARLVARAQAEGEPVAWVALREGPSFYPPDFARVGVDLAALVVVRVPASDMAGSPSAARPPHRVGAAPDRAAESPVAAQPPRHAVLKAAEVLLRSGAFGLVVVDLSISANNDGVPGRFRGHPVTVPRGELSWQTRLSGLLRAHDARLVLLTRSHCDEPSLGPLVALRTAPELSVEGGRAVLAQRVLKAKLGQHGEPSPDVRSLPEGMV
jgi:hypothetical protein